jgi:hypothetical protein
VRAHYSLHVLHAHYVLHVVHAQHDVLIVCAHHALSAVRAILYYVPVKLTYSTTSTGEA